MMSPTSAPTAVPRLQLHETTEPVDLSWSGRLIRWSPVVAAIVVGLWAFNTYPVGVLHDDAVYVILAKSLATGQGYRYLNLPGAPVATHFPPGYPALLALLWLVGGALPLRIILFKLLNVVLLGVIAAELRRILRERLEFGVVASAGLALISAISVPLVVLTAMVMSETLFLAVVLIALVVSERAVADESSYKRLLIAAATAAASLLVRTHGIALVGALVLALVSNRRWRDAGLSAALGLIALVPWQLWTSAHKANVPSVLQGAYGSYAGWIGDAVRTEGLTFVARTLASNVDRTASTLSTAVAPVVASTPRIIALLAILMLVGFGAQTMWARARTTMLFTSLYMGIVFVWPVEPARYLWGVWPLLVIWPVVGARELWRWYSADSPFRYLQIALLVVTACAGGGYLYGMEQGYNGRYWEDIPRAGAVMLRPIVVGIRSHARPGEVIATPAEAAMYLYTDHQTVPVYTYQPTQLFRNLTLPEKTDALREILTTYPATGLVTSSAGEVQVVSAVNLTGNVALVARDTFPGGAMFDVRKR
jgi:hypothetical protein